MKKCLILYLFILFTTNLFANGKTENLIRIIENSDLWCFDKEQAIKEGKTYIKLTYQTATDFRNKTRNNLNSDLYPNKKKMTYDDLKTVFKSCNSLMFGYSYSTVGEYSWVDGKNLSYSVDYSQIETGRPIDGAGSYVIRVFFNDSVLTILLKDVTENIEQNADYDALSDLLFYKDGKLLDKNRGQERTKGYYWQDEDSIKTFYCLLKNKDSTLPESAIKFQEAAEAIFRMLKDY